LVGERFVVACKGIRGYTPTHWSRAWQTTVGPLSMRKLCTRITDSGTSASEIKSDVASEMFVFAPQ
jgi:hypothetical protein